MSPSSSSPSQQPTRPPTHKNKVIGKLKNLLSSSYESDNRRMAAAAAQNIYDNNSDSDDSEDEEIILPSSPTSSSPSPSSLSPLTSSTSGSHHGDKDVTNRTRSDMGAKTSSEDSGVKREKRSRSEPVKKSSSSSSTLNRNRTGQRDDDNDRDFNLDDDNDDMEEEETVPPEKLRHSRRITVFKRDESSQIEILVRREMLQDMRTPVSSSSKSLAGMAGNRSTAKRRDSIFLRLRAATEEVIQTKQIEQLRDAEEEATYAIKGLPSLRFDVIKIHHLLRSFKKQKRVLMLTTDGVENCKPNGKRTRFFPYSSIRQIMVIDARTFMISYDNSHNYFYQSPLAVQITNLISSRTTKSIRVDKLRLDYEIARRFQRKVSTMSVRRIETNSSSLSDAERLLWLQMERLCSRKNSIEGKTMTEFIKNFPMLERKTSTAASITRQFLTGLREYILEKRLAQVEKLVRAAKTDVPRGALVHDMDSATIVEIALERVLFSALESRLVACFPRQEQQERLEKYRRNRTHLIKKDQGYFDIEKEKQCPEEWMQVVCILDQVDSARMPYEKIMIIMRAVKAIYLSYQERSKSRSSDLTTTNGAQQSEQQQPAFISADEFLPILIYVILHCNIKDPVFTGEFLCEFCDSGLNPESTYYLTTFSSATYYLETWDPQIEAQYLNEHQAST